MAALTIYLKNSTAAGSSHGSLQVGGSAPGVAFTSTGWNMGTLAANNYGTQIYNTLLITGNMGVGVRPLSSLSTTGGWRSENKLLGTFANANWTVALAFQRSGTAATAQIAARWNFFRSANADGSSATQIWAAQQGSSISVTAESISTLTANPGAITLNNEYLIIQVAIRTIVAGSDSTANAYIRVGNSVITTSDFVEPVVDPMGTSGFFGF
jgi:hypothetical protein